MNNMYEFEGKEIVTLRRCFKWMLHERYTFEGPTQVMI